VQIFDPTSLFLIADGEFRRHAWLKSSETSEDTFSLFTSRAVAMGWSDFDAFATPLWHMNDAGLNELPGGGHANAWFQVSLLLRRTIRPRSPSRRSAPAHKEHWSGLVRSHRVLFVFCRRY
jgi:hypothetical protein